MDEREFSYQNAFDGNDFNATHFLMLSGDDPIGTSRVRWFADFAKIEMTAFRRDHRSIRILKTYTQFIFDHVAQKGYSTLMTMSLEKYAQVWERFFGFERVPGKETRRPGSDVVLYEMIKRLNVPADAVSLQSDPAILARIEGDWGTAGLFG